MNSAKLWLLCCALAGLSGCAQVGWVKTKIASGVDDYCSRVTPAERMLIRSEVNATLATKGHQIQVTCKQDQQ